MLRRHKRCARAVLAACACALTGISVIPAAALAAPPAVTAIAPNNGPANGATSVTIAGSGFVAGSTDAFGEAAATGVSVVSSTKITAASPPGSGTLAVRVRNQNGVSEAVPADQFAYDPAPSSTWLGLNGNSSTYLGPVDAYLEEGVAYDRSGPIEFRAGQIPKAGGALEADMRDGMIPVVVIDYAGYHGQFSSDPKFPTEEGGSLTLRKYVKGFVRTASAILADYPGKTVLFEPMNEPWGYTTPQYDGAPYAAVIAKLLPVAREAGIPASSIYVAAFGKHWIREMYESRPSLQIEVQGWYFHPYGPASGSADENSAGIQSLPAVQAEMTSGQNNIIVSEVGYCSDEVNGAKGCHPGETSAQAAANLSLMLANALPYHRAGWLRVLLVYSRNDGGWAMQLSGGAFTEDGEALSAFAKAQQQASRAQAARRRRLRARRRIKQR